MKMNENFSTRLFMQNLINDEIQVSIYLRRGIKLIGKITAVDDKAMILRNTVSQIVYKHAVTTILPNALRIE